MGEFVAQNMLGWFKKINKRKSCCILLVIYIVELMMHGHTNIKFSSSVFAALNNRVISELWIVKDAAGSNHSQTVNPTLSCQFLE